MKTIKKVVNVHLTPDEIKIIKAKAAEQKRSVAQRCALTLVAAANDVAATVKCFWKLERLGVIKI